MRVDTPGIALGTLGILGAELASSPIDPAPLRIWSWIDLVCAILLALEVLLFFVLLRGEFILLPGVPLLARMGLSLLPLAGAIWAGVLWRFAADAYYQYDLVLHSPPGHAPPHYEAYNGRFLQALHVVVWQSVLILAIVAVFLVADVWLLRRRKHTGRESSSTAGTPLPR